MGNPKGSKGYLGDKSAGFRMDGYKYGSSELAYCSQASAILNWEVWSWML